MKKNISINIGGIIFHIEEDAFDLLKEYLDGINRYFSTFNDSQEIIADIEGRIAEIFLTKLNEDKQVITLEDVEALKTTMGSIRDFQAVEEEFGNEQQSDSTSQERTFEGAGETKKLYRDEKRKLIAGVCAGIAHYFSIDPLWIRLIFFILLIGSGGIILPVYIVMWLVVPGNSALPEDKKLKKMFRDPESKVVGGVSSGLANYFGIDVVVVRVLFVLSLFIGGVGLLTYIILWIVLPEAKSVSDKVQMKGDPVTLSNIETNIKQGLNVKENENENVFVKLLLFPFRLVAAVLDFLGKLLGPFARFLVDFIRIVVGVLLILTGVAVIFSVIVSVGVIIGIFSSDLVDAGIFNMGHMGLPLDAMTNGIPGWTIAAAVCASVIPFFFLTLLGSSIIAQRITFSSNTGWTLFAGFVVSILILAVNIPTILINFSEDGEYSETKTFELSPHTAILTLKDAGNREYDLTSLRLRGYNGSTYKLEQVFEAQGRSIVDAEENARMVSYNVIQQDSTLYFDSNLSFARDAVFRAQRLEMTLYIPYGAKFVIDRDMRNILRNTIYRNGYRMSDLDDNTWTFTKNGLQCLTCSKERWRSDRWSDDSDDEVTTDIDIDVNVDEPTVVIDIKESEYDKTYQFDPFDEIEIEGAFTVNIERGDEPRLLIKGRDENIDELNVRQYGDRVTVSMLGDYDDIRALNLSRNEIELTFITNDVRKLEVTGACKAYMNNFSLDKLKVDLLGACSLKADMLVDDLDVELTGASKMEIRGKGTDLRADVTGASHLDARSFKARYGRLNADGVSSIHAYLTDDVTMDETFISNIKVRGGAKIND